jgi:hypothetical protein
MSIFLDTTGRSTYGVGICARCSCKFSLEDLYSDPNSPGLKVCRDDIDQYDPYRLPPRQPDDLTLPFYRPDEPLDAGGPIPNTTSLFGVRATEGGNLRVTAGGNLRVLESADVTRDW